MKAQAEREFVASGRFFVNLRTLAMARFDEDAETGEPSTLLTFTSSKRARVRGPEVEPLRQFFQANAYMANATPRRGMADSGPGEVDPPVPG